MRAYVALVGFRKPPPDCRGEEFVPLPQSALFGRGLDRFRWIVLGDAVVDGHDPRRAAAAVGSLRDRIIVCVKECEALACAAWIHAGFSPVLGVGDLAPYLAMPRHKFVRPPTPSHGWMDRVVAPDTRGAVALAALEDTWPLTVEAWADRVGWSEGKLRAVIGTEFDAPLLAIVDRYRLFLIEHLRSTGRADWECAEAVDLFDAPSLYRFCRRMGVELPPRRD